MKEDRSIARHDFEPDACLECSGLDIERDLPSVEGQEARQEVRCEDCGCCWVDVYRIDRRQIVTDHYRGNKRFYTIFIQEDEC